MFVEAKSRAEDAESRFASQAQDTALQRNRAEDLAERLDATSGQLQQSEADAQARAEQLVQLQRQLEEERVVREGAAAEAQRRQAELTERLDATSGQLQQSEADAQARAEQLVQLQRQLEEERAGREEAVSGARRLTAELTNLGDRLIEEIAGRAATEQECERERERLLADLANLAERHQRITQDHMGLAERYEKLEVENCRLAEQSAKLTIEHTVVSQNLTDEISNQDRILREAGARIAVLEEELRRLSDHQARAAEERQQRTDGMILQFSDQLREAFAAAERHATEKALLSERLLAAEKDHAASVLTAEQREQARIDGLTREMDRMRCELERSLDVNVKRHLAAIEEASRREAALRDQNDALTTEMATLRAALETLDAEANAARMRGEIQAAAIESLRARIGEVESSEIQLILERDALRAELSAAQRSHDEELRVLRTGSAEERRILQIAAADRAAERDAAYDRLREAKSEKEALIQQMGRLLLATPGEQNAAITEGAVQGLREEVAALRRSTSWRVTAPLRAIARMFGRRAG
jgi:hypothetical protein